MVKRSLIIILFSMIINVLFAVEYGHYIPAQDDCFDNNLGNQLVIGSGFGYQSIVLNMPYSNKPQLRAGVLCPVCDEDDIVDGVCQNCGYVLGTGSGTENTPIGDSLWILSALACVYFYYRLRHCKIKKKNDLLEIEF